MRPPSPLKRREGGLPLRRVGTRGEQRDPRSKAGLTRPLQLGVNSASITSSSAPPDGVSDPDPGPGGACAVNPW